MAKVHKPVTDRCPSLRPIVSAINTPSYKLAKFLIPLLTPSTSNDFTMGFLKTTDQSTTFHRPTDHRPVAPTTDQPKNKTQSIYV